MMFASLLEEDRFLVEGIVDEIWVKAGKRALRYSLAGMFLGAHILSFTTPVKRVFYIERIYNGI